ncbi:hypothetical protein ACFW8Q_001693 [Salmonella enterica]|nr:hypothetical protein [Salmonella enterica]ECR4969949.1 hypothetical protein [Salmonella enterica]EEF8439404.1 hypothetical protein [Salmonella enterica]EGP9458735.1 hypothetical protein [Salmonella enterica]EIO4971075.1 hypothetical protein [Salmonella enterica]
MERQQRADQEISRLTDRGALLEQLRDEVHLEMTSENYIGAHRFVAAKRPNIKLKLLINDSVMQKMMKTMREHFPRRTVLVRLSRDSR